MEIRVLRYFLTVVREESITKAAEAVAAMHPDSPLAEKESVTVEDLKGLPLIIKGSISFWDEKKIAYRPLLPELKASSVLAWKRQRPFSLAATKFIEHMKRELEGCRQ